MKTLFALNPAIDRAGAAARFSRHSRVQIRDVLTEEAARELQAVLAHHTPWGMAAQADGTPVAGPQHITAAELRRDEARKRAEHINAAVMAANRAGNYAFRFAQYPIVMALQQGWDRGGPHEILLEHLNTEAFLGLAREVTGIATLGKADAQATLFGAQHFLGRHIDSHVAEGWRVAYVISLAPERWHPDWGGYLVFYDEDGNVVEGYRPRFNALNLFAVPQSHAVTMVSPAAPIGRWAITGWLRDR